MIAEAKALELRKIDFETLERDLVELQRDLEEREKALHPDVTIFNSSNVSWVAETEADVIGADQSRRRRRPSAESDYSLPVETRRLARAMRRSERELAVGATVASNAVVNTLQRLYVEALKEDRVVDADFYLHSIRMYYPNWTYQQEQEEKK